MRAYPFVLLFCLGITPFTVSPQSLRFQHITMKDGLTDHTVTCLYEDREGAIWIGTERGLHRYDGQRIELFGQGDQGPPGRHITSIAEDHLGRLWVSTADAGLGMREKPGRPFIHFGMAQPSPRHLPSDQLNHVLPTTNGLLILSTRDQGAVWFDPERGTVTRSIIWPVEEGTDPPQKAHTGNWCHVALRIQEGEVWLPMIHPRASCIVAEASGTMKRGIPTLNGAILTNGLRVGDQLFTGGWDAGIQRIPLNGGAPEPVPAKDAVIGMVPWGQGHILCGTQVSGLVEIDQHGRIVAEHRHVRQDPSSPLSDRVRCLMRDRQGNLWVGTAKGLSVHAPAVQHYEVIPLLTDQLDGDPTIHRIQEESNGIVRLSTSRGSMLVNTHTGHVQRIPLRADGLDLDVTGLFRLHPSMAFIGTETGFYRYLPEEERIPADHEVQGMHSQGGYMYQIRSMFLDTVDGEPSLIVGALGYAHSLYDIRLKKLRAEWRDMRWPPTAAMIRTTVRDRHGQYWSGHDRGLARWSAVGVGRPLDETHYHQGAPHGFQLPGKEVAALHTAPDTLWVAFRDGALAWVVNGRSDGIPVPEHLPNDLMGITQDPHGHLWMTTSSALLRYTPRLDEWIQVPIHTSEATNMLDGPITLLKDGRLACSANQRLILVDPRNFASLPPIPRPVLVKVRNSTGDLEPDPDHRIRITYNSASFDAWVSALAPTGARPLLFRYHLEGTEVAPRTTTATGPIRFTGLPPGRHRLIVRVQDPYGRIGPATEQLTILVAAPFWQRWWFFALLLATGATVMYLIARARQRQRSRQRSIRDRIARDLHDDIGSALGSINFYSEALRRKLEGEQDEVARQVAEKIGVTSRSMIEQMSDIVWSVDPEKDDVAALEERMRQFATDLTASRSIRLEWRITGRPEGLVLGAEQRRNLFLIFKEAVHNSVKYAGSPTLHVRVSSARDRFGIHVIDEGQGFDPANTDAYNGNGLPNMHRRAASIGAVLQVESKPGKGTRVIVTIRHDQLLTRKGD